MDTIGKILERVIYNRLLAEAEKKKRLSEMQFVDGRTRPTYKKIVASCLHDRILLCNSSEGNHSYQITAGVPQGSVLGPLLWNLMYDDLLRIQIPEATTIIGFADDIAIVSTGKHIPVVENKINSTINKVKAWLCSKSLELADDKTEALLTSSRKKWSMPL